MNIQLRRAIFDRAFLRNGRILIDGKWIEAQSGKSFDSINPATGEVLSSVAEGGSEDIDLAVRSARAALEGAWGKVKPAERQRMLLKVADLVEANFDELALLETLDMGAPLSRTKSRRARVLGMLRYYAGLATGLHGETIDNSLAGNIISYAVKEPVGVVGSITAWNGPLAATVWKLAPAIATGCTTVLKPAEQAPLIALYFGQLLLDAGVPPGVVNIVTGYGHTAGSALAHHLDVDKLAFTGSTATGQKLIEASAVNVKRLSLELGGKSANIVFADADMDIAVKGAALAIFLNSGQICSAGSRLYVERKIYPEFIERVAQYSKTLKVGDGTLADTDIGPLVSERQLERVSGYLSSGRDQGARIVCGGNRVTGADFDKGYFIAPTIFGDVKDDMKIAREEIFGPVLAAAAFDDTDEVIRRANASQFGLGSGVWTRDLSTAHKMAARLKAGSVWINCYQTTDPAVPFGGYKMSGYGRESGIHHVEEFLNTKAVWINT